MKKLFLLILSLTAPLMAAAQIVPSTTPEADSAAFAQVRERMDSIRQYRPTVALVLAGGGARGMAHIGVIRYLEELGIPVDLVTGTSIGSLVGGLYALGYDHRQLDSLVRSIDWPVMMSDRIPDRYLSYDSKRFRERFLLDIPLSVPDGYLDGLNVRNLLSAVSVGYQDSISFASLPIPFACVATDVYSQTPKYWTGGSLTTAMRSSMAIPLYFRSVRTDGAILVDGGLRDNFPADIAREMGADILIGSHMYNPKELDQIDNPVEVAKQTLDLTSSDVEAATVRMVDLYVNHKLEGISQMDFDAEHIDEIIRQGYQNALDKKEVFEALAARVSGRPAPAVAHPAPAVDISGTRVRVAQVLFNGIPQEERDRILRPRDYPADGLYDRNAVERLLGRLYGTRAFEAVTYRLEGQAEPYTLVFDCQKGPANEVAASLHADTDEAVYAAARLGLGTRRLSGLRLAADLKVGVNPYLGLDASYRPGIALPTIGIALGARRFKTAVGNQKQVEQELVSTFLDLYAASSRLTYGSIKAGFSYEMNPYERYVSEGGSRSGWDWKTHWLSAFASLKFDTFDDGYFPVRGVRASLDGRYVFTGQDYLSASAALEAAWTPFGRFTIHPALYLGMYTDDLPLMNPRHVVSVGGFLRNRYVDHQLPFFGFPGGYCNCRPLSGVAQLDFRYRIAGKHFVTLRGGLFQDANALKDFFRNVPVYAVGAEYACRSIVGPLKFSAQWCSVGGVSAFVSVGFDF